MDKKLKAISDYDIEISNDMRKDERDLSTLSQAVRDKVLSLAELGQCGLCFLPDSLAAYYNSL